MSNVALAQTLQQQGPPAPSTTAPFMPVTASEPEIARPERIQAGQQGPLTTPPIDQPVDPDTYVCGPGDVLELNFWGMQNFRLRAPIDVEGRAFVAKVGYFNLRGKTLTQARRTMRDSVARFFPRLSFDVTLAEPRTFLVQVVDAVSRPGSYPARATDRVATLIAHAGGLGPGGSRRRVEIRRRDGDVVRADLLLYSMTGDVRHNPFLLDGDVVRVPFEDLAASITGGVNRPGGYELVGSRDLAELVDLGGGLSASATRRLPIRVVRRTTEDRHEQQLIPFGADGTLPTLAVRDGDVVTIPTVDELQQSVTVVGAIAGAATTTASTSAPAQGGGAASAAVRSTAPAEESATRRLAFVEGDSVRTLIERVGGVGPLADLAGAYIMRQGHSLPVDLHALIMLRDMTADRPIELGDTLVIPFKRRNVLVEGAVFAPGSYPYSPTFGVDQYLGLAGGPSRNAKDLKDVKLVTPDGKMQPYAQGQQVEPGSSIVVPERSFSRTEVVQILLGAAGIVLSGVAVVIAARK